MMSRVVLVLSVLCVGLLSLLPYTSAETKAPTHKIRWLLAHEPVRVFERAAKQFKTEVEKESNGRIAVEILTSSEYIAKYGAAPKYKTGPVLDDVALVRDGQVELTQTYTTELGRLSPTMWVLDLPFLFRDHAHAKTVIDGQVGQKIMDGLLASNVRGLAFTYSGGYRVISSRGKAITSVEDFKKLTIRTARSPVAQAMFQTLGATAIPMSHDVGIQKVREGSIMATETTIARFDESQQKATPILNDTQHSLFLTSMVVNESFFAKIPQDLQVIVKKAARNAAELERQDSLTDEAQLRKAFAANGMKVVALAPAEVSKMREMTKPLYSQFTNMFGAELIESIRSAK